LFQQETGRSISTGLLKMNFQSSRMKENASVFKFNPYAEILHLEETLAVFFVEGNRHTFKHPHAMKIISFLKNYFQTFQLPPEDKNINKLINVFVENGLLYVKQQSSAAVKFGLLTFSVDAISVKQQLVEINFSSGHESLIECEIFDLECLHVNLLNLKKSDFIFIVTRPSEYSKLHQLNEFFLKHQINWIWSVISENYFQVGPFFKGAENFCFECFHSRVIAKSIDYESELKILNSINECEKTKIEQFDVSRMMIKLFLDQLREVYEKVLLEEKKITILNGCFEYRGVEFSFEKFYLLGSPVCKACQNR
jgi:sulfur relay (sulfurtransferase) DsrC/TusE family protein